MKRPWRCATCGKNMIAAARERQRLGLPALRVNARVCSAACGQRREKPYRALVHKIVKEAKAKIPRVRRPPGTWTCNECGASWRQALRKRRRLRGLQLLPLRAEQRTCSPACARAFELRLYGWARAEAWRRVTVQRPR